MKSERDIHVEPSWLDRAVGYLSPQRGLKRIRARVAADLLVRHYEGAAVGRRTQGWKRTNADANAAMGASLSRLRDHARDLVRNNPHASRATSTIANQVVGWGIVAKPSTKNQAAADAWKAWALSPSCDADGRHDFYGLQKLAMRSIVESGEVLIRRRFRLPEDGLPLPIQLQLLEPDYIDTSRTGIVLPNGGKIIHGIEFDPIGRRVAYWLFPNHPGSSLSMFATGMLGGNSVRVPADNILHVYHQERLGQVRAASWFAPILLKLKDYDEYDDAQLMKQKIAACLAVLTSDVDGTAAPLGTVDDTSADPQIDSLEPGLIMNLPPGRTVTVVDPPRVNEFNAYAEITLRTIAAGIGVTYEDLTGDYTDLPFSAARMSRLAHQARVDDWRWRTLIPQFCDPIWRWAMEAAAIMGQVRGDAPTASWTPPPVPYIDPDKEGLAFQRNIRGGAQTWSESVRERGYDPDELLKEYASDNKKFDDLGIILDSDARMTTQQGGPRTSSTPSTPEPPKTGEPTNGSQA
jgi:lambda family phage portal protein